MEHGKLPERVSHEHSKLSGAQEILVSRVHQKLKTQSAKHETFSELEKVTYGNFHI